MTSYERAVEDLGIGDLVRVMPGVETTGQVLFHRPPGSEIPQVIGHYNFWPLSSDVSAPRNGAPWDELLEPGAQLDLQPGVVERHAGRRRDRRQQLRFVVERGVVEQHGHGGAVTDDRGG